MSNTMSIRLATLLGVVLILIGASIGFLFAPTPVPATWKSDTTVSYLETKVADYYQSEEWNGKADIAPVSQLESPSGGVIVKYDCQPDQVINSATVVMQLNQQPILALHLQQPPYRDLSMGAKGEDVLALQSELIRLGYAVTADSFFGQATAGALVDIWRQQGYTHDGSFKMEETIWLPTPQVHVDTCPVGVGAKLASGVPVYNINKVIRAIKLTAPDGGRRSADRVIEYGTNTVTVSKDGVVTDRKFLDSYAQSPQFQTWLAKPSEPLRITTKLKVPLRTITVPPQSLYNVQGTKACILGKTPIPVLIVANELSNTIVALDTGVDGFGSGHDLPGTVALNPATDSKKCR